ncbi:hypothetical protein JCM10213_008927 [Rhodosporidiobolus nylandii]
MLGLLHRTAANLKNPSTPTTWSPTDPLPSGFSQRSFRFSLPVSSLAAFTFRSAGQYARGSIVFERAAGPQPPEYGEAVPVEGGDDGKERTEGLVEIAVEARTNSDGLLGECKLDPIEGHERCGLSLSTPSSTGVSRIGATLSYHITVTFPATLAALNSLTVEAASFRISLEPSLSSTLISSLDLSTTDAPISLGSTRAQQVKLTNKNWLDSNRVALKNFDDLVSGSIADAERIEITCADGSVSGSYTSSGPIIVQTTNAAVHADLRGSSLRVSTSGGDVTGMYIATKDVALSTSYAKADVDVEAPLGCQVSGTNVAIDSRFKVGKELRLITSHFRIDASVWLLPPPVPGTPALSITDAPPTFEEATSSPSLGASNTVLVQAETTGAAIQLDYLEHPDGLVLQSLARSTGGGAVQVVHPETFEGSFLASTSLTHTAQFTTPAVFPTAARKRAVHFDVEKRSEVAGTVRWEGGSVGGGRSRTVIEAEGTAEIKVL